MVFVYGVDFLFYFYFYWMAWHCMTLVLGANITVGMSIETHLTCDKPFILKNKNKKDDKATYF
jgi:hypothetical protein